MPRRSPNDGTLRLPNGDDDRHAAHDVRGIIVSRLRLQRDCMLSQKFSWSYILRVGQGCEVNKVQTNATKLIPGLVVTLRYEERPKDCGVTVLETHGLRWGQIEVLLILNGCEHI